MTEFEKQRSEIINQECAKADIFYMPLADAEVLMMANDADFKRQLEMAIASRKAAA